MSLSDGRHAGDNDDKVETVEEVLKNSKDKTALSSNDSLGSTHDAGDTDSIKSKIESKKGQIPDDESDVHIHNENYGTPGGRTNDSNTRGAD